MAYLSGDQRSQLGGSLCGGFYVGACPVIRLCLVCCFIFEMKSVHQGEISGWCFDEREISGDVVLLLWAGG